MGIEFDIFGDQIDGARDYQEDAFLINLLGVCDNGDHNALVIMADGMGGHAAGNIASNLVVASFSKTFQKHFESMEISEALSNSLHKANIELRESVADTPALQGMGCTVVVVYVRDFKLWWISVGDSHLYLIRDQEITKLNADHSYGAYIDMMQGQGLETEDMDGMSRNMLMSAVTGEDIHTVDVTEQPFEMEEGDRLIISSDGLDSISEGAIQQYSSWSDGPKDCVNALLNSVDEANRINQDNTTIIVIDAEENHEHDTLVELKTDAEFDLGVSEQSQHQSTFQPYEKVHPRPVSYMNFPSLRVVGWLIISVVMSVTLYFGITNRWLQDGWSQVMSWVDPVINQIEESVTAKKVDEPLEAVEKTKEIAESKKLDDPVEDPDVEQELPKQVIKKSPPFRDRLSNGARGPLMVSLPANEFEMGASSSIVAADESPRHRVKIKAFMMSVYEVTYAEYDIFARATNRNSPSSGGLNRKQYPVKNVSWKNADAYSKWLSKQTRKKYRLPSEAEWEYAARAGTTSSYWWGTEVGDNNAHCFNCLKGKTLSKPAKVGSYKSNGLGLYDTAGNMFEWVADCYNRNYQDAPVDGSVWQQGDCKSRVARGGSYSSPASSMRVENREHYPLNKGRFNVGIRLARDR